MANFNHSFSLIIKRQIRFLSIILIVTTFRGNLFAQTSYIQVISEPGISVFIDGIFKGKTNSEFSGLIIENIQPGYRIIRVVKEGFNPQEEGITLKPGEVYTYKVRPFISNIKIIQKGNESQQTISLQVGKLKIQSLPISINISIPSLGITNHKYQDTWEGQEISVGYYGVTFNWNDKTLTDSIQIYNMKTTRLFVNMLKGTVEIRAPLTEYQSEDANYDTFTDSRDGQLYNTVKIGNQIWMAENLNYELTQGSYCYNDYQENCNYLGKLYTWNTAKMVCPSGWHLPSASAWDALISYLGEDPGIKLMSSKGWRESYSKTNLSGFSAIAAGQRSLGYQQKYWSLNDYALFWTSTEYDVSKAMHINIFQYEGRINRESQFK